MKMKKTTKEVPPAVPVITGGIDISLPSDADRMRVLQTLADGILAVANAIADPPVVSFDRCTIYGPVGGAATINVKKA